MRATSRKRRGARAAVSWVLALALGLSGWPAPALQALAETAEAAADEDVVSADEVAAEEDLTIQEPEADATESTDETGPSGTADEGVAPTEADGTEATAEVADPAGEQQAQAADELIPAESDAPATGVPEAPLKAAEGEGDDTEGDGLYEYPYDVNYPYDAFINGTEKNVQILNIFDDATYTIDFDVHAIEDSDLHSNVQPGSAPGANDNYYAIRVQMGTMYTVKEATETTPSECAYKEDACWGDPGDVSRPADRTSGSAFVKNYDRATGTGSVTINTAWLYENYYKDHQDEQLTVEIWVCIPLYEHPDTYVHAHPYHPTGQSFWVRTTNLDYRPVEGRTMLPGWTERIDRYNDAWVEDSAHPWGENVPYEVTSVEHISGDDCLSIEEQDGGWDVRATGHGTATVRATHTTVDGGTDSYDITYTVADTVCDVDLWVEGDSGSTIAFPGESIALTGRGVQHREDDADSYDGFAYRWEVVKGGDVAIVSASDNADGSSTATVSFSTYDGEGFYNQDVLVRVTATKDGESASRDMWLSVSNDYPEIWIAETDSCTINPTALPMGSSMQVTPQVRRFTQGQDGYSVCDLHALRWYFDENSLSITAADGTQVHDGDSVAPGTFTLKRTGDWGTNIALDADWADPDSPFADEYGLRYEHTDWWLFDCHMNVWLDDQGQCDVFGDGTLSLWVRQDGAIADPYKIYVNVGPWEMGPGEEGFDWSQGFAEGDAYTYDRQTGEVVLNGAWLAAQGYDHVQVFVALAYEPEGQEDSWALIGNGDGRWINVRDAFVDYDHEWDRDLLPGWDGTVNGSYDVHVEDSAHPDGWNGPYTVTNVEVIEGAELLEDFHRDQNEDDASDYWWYYRAGNEFGTATLRVTYDVPEELGGGSDSYTFDLNIGGNVYDIDIVGSPEDDNILPGGTVDIYAQAVRHHAERQTDGEGNIWYEHSDSSDGLTYTWKVVEGADVGTLVVDANDPSHATFTAKSPSADKMGFDDFVHVRVYLHDGDEQVRDTGWAFNVRNTFVEPQPVSINRHLNAGESETFDLNLFRSVYGEGRTAIEDAQFFFWYDPACVSITDAQGKELVNNGDREGDDEVSYPAGTYTITRLRDWGTDISLRAVWFEERGEGEEPERRECWRNWWLDDLNYDLWFDQGEYETSVDCVATIKLNVSRISGIPDYADHLSLHVGAGWDEGAGQFEQALAADEYTVAQGSDTWTITIPGSVVQEKLAEWHCMGLEVVALFDMQAEHDIWRQQGTFVALTNEPAHALAHVAAKAATLTTAGNKEYWSCDHCGKLFADAEGTTETTKAAVTIAKLVNVSGATITVAAKTYTGKALTFAPVVKLGGKTLKSGTDYTVSANKQTKVGTYTLKITGKGLYGGSKTAKFTINPAAQTITASNKEVVTGKTVKLGAKASGGGKLTYKSSNAKVAKVSTTGVVTGVKAGTATITITAAKTANYKAVTKKVTVKVGKANTVTAKAKKTIVAASLKTLKSKTVVLASNVTVAKPVGKVTYANASTNATAKKFKVAASTGKVTIPKGTKAGKYLVVLTVKAAGNSSTISGTKTVKFYVQVK